MKRPLRKVVLIKDSPDQPFFRAGEPILETGIYRAFHGDHRVTHEVTLLRGEAFPECKQCGLLVHFELVRAAPAIDHESDFRVRLYQVPHPDEEAEQDAEESEAAAG